MAAGKKDDSDGLKPICRNRRAYHEYEVFETLECGLVLTGTEVKSLRDGAGSLEEAYAKIQGRELWLIGSDIPEYAMGNIFNHKPKRPRKLLVHRREIKRLENATREKGTTLIPLAIYFNAEGMAKLELAVGRGKQQHDKRASIKKKEQDRDLRRLTTTRQ